MIENWDLRKRPVRLERRIEFDNYELTREFLDQTADLSEKEGFYPDMNFGSKHVSMTIHANESDGEFEPAQIRFAEEVNRFAPTNKIGTPLSGDYVSEEN